MTENAVVENMRLGKQAHKHDERTLMMADFLKVPTTGIPQAYDFEAHRTAFPPHMWGNDEYGDCVRAARANQQLRFQRIESHLTIPITDPMVIDGYKETTGCRSPGDDNDSGLVILDDFKLWRSGWHLPVWKTGRTYSIDAFGLLNYQDRSELRAGAYLLTGVQFGINLPISASDQIRAGKAWDVEDGPRGEAGTWGGHCVYSCHFDEGGFYVWTWAQKQYMTNAFIEKYADEAWAAVQSNETHSRYVDVASLNSYLSEIGAHREN